MPLPLAIAPLSIAAGGAVAALAAGRVRPRWAAPVSVAAAVVALAATAIAARDGAALDVPWAPAWGLRLAFVFDGLAALYALLTAGVGLAVLVYSAGYLPRHLARHREPPGEAGRFHALVLAFMAAMLALVTAQDLLLQFLAWEATTVVSYLLIGFDRRRPEVRSAALMALLVTGSTGILLMAGVVGLAVRHGTTAVPALLARAADTPPALVALVVVAALAKSAQAPLHFWLPRAMAAPTPVSAYLHSAAMVAAGVFLLTRLHPLVAAHAPLLDALVAVGALSMGVGGALALTRSQLKPLLAASTIAHYGYATVLLGLGGASGVAAAALYVLAHALAKSALFLTAGAVTEATGEDDLDRLGGLGRPMPVLAASAGVAAAALAGAPLTLGFFKDEVFLAAALERGAGAAALAVAGAAVTVAYTWRFWSGIFLGSRTAEVGPVPPTLVAPVAALAALALAGGLAPGPAARLPEAAARAVGLPAGLDLAYHLDARPTNLLALAVFAGGAALAATRRWWIAGAAAAVDAIGRGGPEQWYRFALAGLNGVSRRILRIELQTLRGRLAAVLVPSAVLVGAGVFASPAIRPGALWRIAPADLPLALACALLVLAALGTTTRRHHLAIALSLSGVGFTLAAAYAFFGAPDVALVAVLVETLLSLLLLGVLALFPRRLLAWQATREPARARWRDPLLAVLAGGTAFAVALVALSEKTPPVTTAGGRLLALAPSAHGQDVVTVVLADLRGLDTMGEITVLGIALVGILTLLGRRRPQ